MGVANRRNYPRYKQRLRAQYREAGDPAWKGCFTYDVSVSGVFLESSKIPRTEKLEIEINLPGERVVRMVGQIVRGTRVPTQLVRAARGGFACKILEASSDWWEFCLSLEG
jgi:hypothetical protein